MPAAPAAAATPIALIPNLFQFHDGVAGASGVEAFGLVTAAVERFASSNCVVTLPFVLLIVWSLRVRGSIVWLGAFWGGLVGFAAVLPFMFIGGIGNELVPIDAAVDDEAGRDNGCVSTRPG